MARSQQGLGLACCFALLVAAASATQFRVGGQKGWSVPDAGFEPYNTWAARMRFQIGDQLLFVYPKGTDSVLLVDPAAYNACNTTSYVARFDDGATVFTLDRSGPFFFISGNEASCRANQKLIVVVLAGRSGARTPPPASAPPMPSPSAPPMPSPSAPPMPSPTASPPTGAAPLPAPAATPASPPSTSPAASPPAPAPTTTPTSSPPAPGAMTPSPSTTPGGAPQPPSGSANAPGATTPPPPSPSAAAPAVAGVVGSLGAFIGYALLVA